MKIHEYQGKALFAEVGIPVPAGRPAMDVPEAIAAARGLFDAGHKVVVVKAQIHAGGRGKGGGVKLARSLDEAERHIRAIHGMTLVTHQTGPKGQTVRRLLIETGSSIARELYLAATLDRRLGRVVVMASTEGGMDIEEVAATRPEKIHKIAIDPGHGVGVFQARKLAFALELAPAQHKAFASLLNGLYRLFVEKDASLVEINPLVVTADGQILALDAKLNFDDNALYRHPEIEALVDPSEEDARELEAKRFDLSYISLDGNIGCMVNGAGLAMATMDTIKLYGAEPANFLDVGGGATTEKVAAAFRILLSDDRVQAVLVNIFGGIMRCDTIAQGIVEAAKQVEVKVPLVIRLSGTNVELGKRILAESSLTFLPADDIAEAAEKIVSLVRAA